MSTNTEFLKEILASWQNALPPQWQYHPAAPPTPPSQSPPPPPQGTCADCARFARSTPASAGGHCCLLPPSPEHGRPFTQAAYPACVSFSLKEPAG